VAESSARTGFLDLARAVAVLLMLQGHTLHTVLASDLRTGTAFHIWSFLRGLTACMFLLLSGFTFTIATHRRWAKHLASFETNGRRLRRFGFFLLLGYALHFPTARLANLYGLSQERWRSFLVVDVLQCIAVMLTLLQGLVLVTRTPTRFARAAAAGCFAIVVLTPAVWRLDWTVPLPVGLAAYLSPSTGSLFPLFPWGAYVLLGAVLGDLNIRYGNVSDTRFANRVLLPGSAALVALSIIGARAHLSPLGPTDFWSTSPNQFLLRAGLVLFVLGSVSHVHQRFFRSSYVVQALAQESLTIYAVHLCLVYGSVWNAGLRQLVGPTLSVIPSLSAVAAVWAAMALLACVWQSCKLQRHDIAWKVRLGVAGLLFGRLL